MKKRNKLIGGLLAFFLAAMPFTAMNVRAVDDLTPPSTPTSLTAVLNASNQVFLDWEASTDNTGVSGYKIMRGNAVIANASSTSYLDTAVVASTTYAYSVLAFDASGNNSSSTAQVMITTGAATSTDTTAPTAPTGFSGTAASSTQINLSWTASTDKVAVTGYNIYRNNAWLASTASTSYSVTGLTASTSYAFYIKAYDAKGNLSDSSSTINVSTLSDTTNGDTTIPTAPVLSGTAASSSQINLSWTASTDNIGVNGYNVFMNNNYLGRTASTSWSVTGLNANTEYSFRVRAFDAAGNLSPNSNVIKVTTLSGSGNGNGENDTIAPTVPTNLRIAATTTNSVSLAWNASTDAVGVAGYNIYHDGNWLAMSPTNSFTETGINPNDHHAYYVRAFDERGNVSGQSNIVTSDGSNPIFDNDTATPSVPTNLMVKDTSEHSVKLSWTASTDNVETIGYNVYRNGEWLASIDHATTFVDSGLAASTSYSYYVRAYDMRGNTSGESNTVTATTTGNNSNDDDDDDDESDDNVYQNKNNGNNGNHYGQLKNGNNGKHKGQDKDRNERTSRNWNK